MKYLSLFSGIGGFELGIQQAYEDKLHQSIAGRSEQNLSDNGHKSDNQTSRPTTKPICDVPENIGFSEIDKYAVKIYEQHYQHKNYGDITAINPDELPDFDLICGGFPCQSFSIAGKRGGFEDTRGTLFFEIARIVRAKRPRLILLENVKGLLSHDEGNTFATIIQTIDELGYDCQWQVLNSKNFGVPQNRERVFIIGHLRGTSRPQVFPIGTDSEADIVLPTLTARYWGGQANGGYIGNKPKQIIAGSQGNRVVDPVGISTTLASAAGGLGAKTGLYMIDDPSRKKELRDKNIAPTLRSEAHGNLPIVKVPANNEYLRIRRLTPTECERLQGFPDGWTEGVSDSQRYKCLGNAVTVNVIKAVVSKLLN